MQKAKCPPELMERVEKRPTDRIFLLLRVSEAGDVQQQAIEEAGFDVRYRLALTPCFAVRGPVQGIRALLDAPWLVGVEEDGIVRTL